MEILEYNELDTTGVSRQYQKLVGFLEADDFYSAEVKKLPEYDLYRAKLDDKNRLLFRVMNFREVRYALILEVVLNHAYDKSKFLRGARIDEAKIPLVEKAELEKESLPSITYVNPSRERFHILDKIISFDPEQQEIYRHAYPLIIIGPAGSGKTALTLEKTKRLHGRGLYVTLSPYLADNSRNIYYANHYEAAEQDISFLSFREFLETIRVPEGREITYSAFASWLLRMPRQQRVADAHRLYEEFRGVITGSVIDKPWLTREDYRNLGVKQSIYLQNERELVYALFEKYLAFLKENGFYDPNILAHHYLKQKREAYDFIVVDEVQDITNIQLQLILGSLKNPDHFILCGDSNQIVHPNFFSWSSLKTMLYNSSSLELHKVMRVLQSNFRNAAAVIEISNNLLRIKQKRFGSIDRESNYLMNCVSDKKGGIVFLKDTDRVKRELNQKTKRSTGFAVLVMRDEEKAMARQVFDTPLLFSIHEAKGLEYENVILLNFVSGERASFLEIVSGIKAEDLEGGLEYKRASDKTDKSLEAYKFFVNSLYVALTRAVQKIYFIESDTGHQLLHMLGLKNPQDHLELHIKQSSLEEWQAEARKLELQGRQAQADEIRRGILKAQPVPWEICTTDKISELSAAIQNNKDTSQKPRKMLFDYALFHDEPEIIKLLSAHGFDKARQIYFSKDNLLNFNRSLYEQQRANLLIRDLQAYSGSNNKNILRQCELYGINHRTVFNKTPLMLAACTGNTPLVKELNEAGADTLLTDNYGLTAWQAALERAVTDTKFASGAFPAANELLIPGSLSLKFDDRLIKLDSSQGEFLLFHIFFVFLRHRLNRQSLKEDVPLTAVLLSEIAVSLPDSVIHDYRKKRTYISALLSKNESNSDNPYCKKLFKRKKTGHYILNPKLALRQKDEWVNIYALLNIGFISTLGREGNKYNAFVSYLLEDDEPEKAADKGVAAAVESAGPTAEPEVQQVRQYNLFTDRIK